MKNKKMLIVTIASAIIVILSIIAGLLYTVFVKNVDNQTAEIGPEILMSLKYEKINDNEQDNEKSVKFSAFFTRDIDGDGNAEKLLGSCRGINQTDKLYLNLNVDTKGSLENGKITINSGNFKYKMEMVKDSVLANDYISNDVKEIKLNTVNAGVQKLIMGDIVSNIENNINNYSSNTTITLTGKYIPEDSNEEPIDIEEKVTITVDWHGETRASLNTNSYYYNYDALTSQAISFGITTREVQGELLLQDNVTTVTIPELNGYKPEEVKCTNNNVESSYDEENRILTITKKSDVLETGEVTNSLGRYNTYTIEVIYPQDAYNSITTYTNLTSKVTTYYDGYNNQTTTGFYEDEIFPNPYKSNVAEGTINLIFRETPSTEPSGPVINYDNFYVKILDKQYTYRPNYRRVISKQWLLNLYDNDENVTNKQYIVQWQAVRGNLDEVVNSIVMSETKNGESYGDKWDETIMEEYTSNIGVYFEGADKMLGEDGLIFIYNADTNELIKTFKSDEWNTYTRGNPFEYDEKVKHIRVETSKANESSSLSVYNVKELDVSEILQNFTKEQVQAVDKVYTYLTGICNIEGKETVAENKREDYAYYISEKSYESLQLEQSKMSTQEPLNNQKIYIDAIHSYTGDAKWQDGMFIVEVPKEIINMEINSITTNNSNVEILAYDLFTVKENNEKKYLLKIITKNDNPETFRITVNCNLTADPTKANDSAQFNLYAYNKYCNDYYSEITDIYDVDGDNNKTEKVGSAGASIKLLSPTSLITLETVSNYNQKDEDEITIAPNVAEVNTDVKQAQINLSATNNYPNSISDVKILGKIPFEGNTYIISKKNMNSKFTTTMTAQGIQLPANMAEKVVVYYSENENPTQDLNDVNNGWKTKEEADFSKVKTYLIDLSEYEVKKGEELKFNYVVNLPEEVENINLSSYSDHAIFFNLNTEGGKLYLQTEPSKVGVKLVKKFDLNLTKYKKNSNLKISGVTYTLKYNEDDIDEPGKVNEITRILTTNENGQIHISELSANNELSANKKYTLQEIKVPDTCELNDEIIEFTVDTNSNVTILSGNVKQETTYENDVVNINLEDEVKYDVEITKTKIASDILIDGVNFKIVGGEKNEYNKTARTVNGKATLTGLSLNKEYTLTEISTPLNCNRNDGEFKFKLVRNGDNVNLNILSNTLKIDANISGIKLSEVDNSPDKLTPTLKINIQNEIRYSFNLEKQDAQDNSPLSGVKFKITGKGKNGNTYTTSKEGKISISGLYVGEEYILEETKALGYYLDKNQDNTIKFKIERVGESLQITKWEKGAGIKEASAGTINESTTNLNASISTILLNDKIPTYNLNLVKENEEGDKLQCAQFKLTSEDTGLSKTIATDKNGNATFEGLYQYISGKDFVTGMYTLEEIYAPEGYSLDNTKVKFKATKDNDGDMKIDIIEGDSLIKNDAENEEEKLISSNADGVVLTILNKPIFKLTKKGDKGILLPNAKFTITDLDGNRVVGTDGNIVGELEQIGKKDIKLSSQDPYKWENITDETWVSGGQGVLNVNSKLTSETFTINKKMSLSFDWSVSSEDVRYDYLQYTVKNANTNSTVYSDKIGGTSYGTVYENLQFSNVEKELEAGTYYIEFLYHKDESVDSGTDSGYIKNLCVCEKYPNVVETNEKGEISANLPQGLYKAVEVEAPEGYSLPEDEKNKTYYFGIGESKPEETEFKLTYSNSISSPVIAKLNDVVTNDEGDTIAVGTIYNEVDLNEDNKNELDKYNGIAIKYDKDGNEVWRTLIGGQYDDELTAIAKNPNGGYVVVGYTDSDKVYITTKSEPIETPNFGNEEGLIVKINEDGSYGGLCKTIGGVGYDEINDVAILGSGGDTKIAVVGSYFSSKLYLDVKTSTNSTSILNNAGASEGVSSTRNGFIAVYDNNGNYKWSQNITGSNDIWVNSVTDTESGFAVATNFIGTATIADSIDISANGTDGYVDGVIICYANDGGYITNKQIGGTLNDEIFKIIQDKDKNIVVAGSYTNSITLDTINLNKIGEYDGFVAKYELNNNELKCKSAISIGGSADDTISSLAVTEDGGLLIGGWYYSNSMSIDIDADGNGAKTVNISKYALSYLYCDAIIAKLENTESNEYKVTWFDTIKGDSYDSIYGVAQTADGGYVAVGNFESESLSTSYEDNILTNIGYADGMILKYGDVVTAPEVPTAQNIEVTNELKQFTITTEIGENSEKQRVGAIITGEDIEGETNKKFVERVKYGYNATKDIVITPDVNYSVVKITVNDEEIPFVGDETGTVTIKAEKFENITENKHIVVTLEREMTSVIVHHYLIDEDENGTKTRTTKSIADSETIAGRIGDEYISEPKMNLEDYELAKDNEGKYIIPENASGTFTDEKQEVTYYYEVKKFNLTVHHYLEETDIVIDETEEFSQNYAKGYEYETSKSAKILEDYKFISVDGEEQGTLNEDTIITYYYQKKEYNITTEIVPNSITNILGGTITGEYNNTYTKDKNIKFVETVKKNEDSTKEIVIIPDFGYKVKSIILESTSENEEKTTQIIYGENKEDSAKIVVIEDEDGKVTLKNFKAVTENKHIKVEFEAIENSIIVHHYLKEKNELTTKKVAEDEIIKILPEEEHQVKQKENLQDLRLAKNGNGTEMLPKASVNDETGIIEITYYYEPDDVKLTIEHYFAETGEKIVEDEIIITTPNVLQDEDGFYTIAEIQRYTLEDNENYKEICKNNYIVSVESSIKDNIEIVDILECTLEYNVDSEIKYFYKVKEDCKYVVNYYYDEILDESKTETLVAPTASIIESYTDKNITGYKFEKVKAVNKKGNEVEMPLVVKDDISKNIINVYYVKDSFNYKIKYFYNGKEDASKEKNQTAEYKTRIANYPEENKEGYILYTAKTINENSEEVDLPLIITEDESKNIINVYYVKTKTFKFYKNWSNIPEADVNNYKSTFKLKKTVNGKTTDYKDKNGNTLTLTIVGNGEEEFKNLITYEGTNKIEYSVEEIKVEKTLDGGITWQELPIDDYKSVNNKPDSLVDKVKVGDYVGYNPASGNGTGLSFTSSKAKAGTSITGTFNSSDLNSWRVLGVKDGKIQIIPTQPTSQKITFDGAYAYINSEEMLNEVSAIYGKGEGAIGARSLTAEDLEQYFKFNKNEFENSNSSTGLYEGTKEYNSGSFIVNDEVVTGKQLMTQTSYYYEAKSYRYSADEDEDANKVYNMLFVDINTNSKPYWLATKGVDLQSDKCRFDVLNGNNGYVGRSHLYSSDGSATNNSLRVIPVVTLDSGIDGEKDENGVWQLLQDKKGYTVENTLIANYKIRKEWNIKNPNNYKATFTLMKTIDGVTVEATDDAGNVIKETIIGNGTTTFRNLKPYEDEKAVTYSVVETKIEKTEDNWTSSKEVDMELFSVANKQVNGFDDVITNSLNNKFALNINITEDTENLPLEDINFTISIKDEENNEFTEENKTYTSGADGNLLEIASEILIESENKTYTVTITQISEKEGYKKIENPVTFEVTSRLSDNGVTYILTPETKDVKNTKGIEVEENYILVKLQNNYKAEYEVHYFYDGIEKIDSKESYEAKVGDCIENYTAKPEGQVLEKVKALNEAKEEVNLPLTVRKEKANNIINVYYRTQFEITTKVNKHDEKYKDKIEKNVAGGTISGSEDKPYEKVFKGDDSTKQIKILPNEGYEIVSVKINGVEKLQDLEEKINTEDGSLTLKTSDEYFTNVQEDIEVEAEFRKKTKVTVKYLEKGSNNSLASDRVIYGLEGDIFGTNEEKNKIDREVINNYKAAIVDAENSQGEKFETEISGEIVDGVIKEVLAEIKEDQTGKKYIEGTMYADEITIIYWYEKIPSGVWVRHVEIDEVGKLSGEKAEIKPVEKLTFTELTKEISREIFEGYINVDCPSNMTPQGTSNIVANAEDNSIEVTYQTDETLEIWFFYEQEHKITTEVIPHKETVNGTTKDVYGGTISKNYKLDEHGSVTEEEEEYFEKVLHRGNSTKEIKITPEDDYQVKEVTINDVKQDISSLIKLDGSVTLSVIEDIKENKEVKVEFEKIPTKVIVKYVDIETNEEIKEAKEIEGVVNDNYKVEREEVEGYIIAGEEPNNVEGIMTKENITVTFYYERKRIITTEVKPHTEISKNGNEIQVKGGTISGEDMEVFEYVIKGQNSTKEITIKPDYGYIIKMVTVNDKEVKITNLNEDGSFKLPPFENVTDNIHIIVEYERIPAKVKIQYLEVIQEKDKDTQEEIEVEKEIAEPETIAGYVNDEYSVTPKDIKYYKLIEQKLPSNNNGTMTEEETIVKYYYRKLTFNMKIEKEIQKIILNGKEQEIIDKNIAKVEIEYKNIKDVELAVSYKIKVTNTNEVEGKAKLQEILPKGFELIEEGTTSKWTKIDAKDVSSGELKDRDIYTLETDNIKPGETKEYIVTLKWKQDIANKGEKKNIAQIANTNNIPNYEETALDDNTDEAVVEVTLNRVKEITQNETTDKNTNSKGNKDQLPQTGQTKAIYISLTVIIIISAIGIAMITNKIRKNK